MKKMIAVVALVVGINAPVMANDLPESITLTGSGLIIAYALPLKLLKTGKQNTTDSRVSGAVSLHATLRKIQTLRPYR